MNGEVNHILLITSALIRMNGEINHICDVNTYNIGDEDIFPAITFHAFFIVDSMRITSNCPNQAVFLHSVCNW